MTCIVWDGMTFATDKAASDGTVQWRSVKAWPWNGVLLSGAGPLQSILAMRDWYKGGAFPNEFPSVQLTPHFCHFVVLIRGIGMVRYEQGPEVIEQGFIPCAFGEGQSFALGAMAMGATAYRAVEIANEHSVHCGLGVDIYTIGELNDG